ncbi:hypothetical protein [Thermofilum pendens]|uniref:Uncharacterized protein n=1 Tax=Thermofilum pendens (strain DSM 2475 / Hrk 5) TaxID=368408 RepID=A1RWK9_THEPD|nr:hypothetical protein [Thermofilum pendens]ABL77589.1 hypothetical protein Tpen_0179 [Thermofilum pendens Hrk 5]
MSVQVVEVYVFVERSALLDEKSFTAIDDFMIKVLHEESMYDVLEKAGELPLDRVKLLLREEDLRKLTAYGELALRGEASRKILETLQWSDASGEGYVVLVLKKQNDGGFFNECPSRSTR